MTLDELKVELERGVLDGVRTLFHPTKNGQLTPADVVVGSGRLVYWQCPKSKDHVWRTRVLARTRDGKLAPCPFCARRRVSPSGDNSLAASRLLRLAARARCARQGAPRVRVALSPLTAKP